MQVLADAVESARIAAKTHWGDLSGTEAREVVTLGERLRRLGEVIVAGALDRVGTSREFEVDGHGSAAAWMQSECGTRKSTAQQIARDGRMLRRCRSVDEAARQGELDLDKARLIAKLNEGHLAAGYPVVEEHLVDVACTHRYADLVDEYRYCRQKLDPQGAEDTADRAVEDRHVKLVGTGWGCGDLSGTLEPITFATVSREVDRLEHELFEQDWAEARERLGHEPELADLERTAAQRRHDALGLMAQRSAAFTGRVGPAGCVNLTMDWATFFAETARLLGHTGVALPEQMTCELDDGTVVPASLAVNAAFAGWVRRCVIGPDGEVLDYGRARRLFTATQRQAIIARSARRRCEHEHGCDEPATRCQTDHLDEWEDGGPTDLANGDLLCQHHNRWKHRHKHDPPP